MYFSHWGAYTTLPCLPRPLFGWGHPSPPSLLFGVELSSRAPALWVCGPTRWLIRPSLFVIFSKTVHQHNEHMFSLAPNSESVELSFSQPTTYIPLLTQLTIPKVTKSYCIAVPVRRTVFLPLWAGRRLRCNSAYLNGSHGRLSSCDRSLSSASRCTVPFSMTQWCAHYRGDCFYPRDAMLERGIEITTCPSVRPSVRHAPVLCQNEES